MRIGQSENMTKSITTSGPLRNQNLRKLKKQNIDRELKEADEKFNANRPVDIDYESMTVSQLKDQLIELGVKTRLKVKHKLIELLQKEMKSRLDK